MRRITGTSRGRVGESRMRSVRRLAHEENGPVPSPEWTILKIQLKMEKGEYTVLLA